MGMLGRTLKYGRAKAAFYKTVDFWNFHRVCSQPLIARQMTPNSMILLPSSYLWTKQHIIFGKTVGLWMGLHLSPMPDRVQVDSPKSTI
jgi:hypothetical protein